MKNRKLELIRGSAALMVFLYHAAMNFTNFGNFPLVHYLFNWGTEAVIVFFVLSGIVIYVSQHNKPRSAGQFLLNRLKRLYPLYLAGLLLGYALSGWNLQTFMGNLFFLGTLQAYIVPVPFDNPVLWSLSFEMFFYLMYYCYLALDRNKYFMIAWVAASILCVPCYYLHLTGVAGHLICMLAFSSLWLIGYFAAKYIDSFPRITLQQALFASGMVLICSRIDFTQEAYSIVRYLVFAFVSLPAFIYSMQDWKTENKKLEWKYLALVYVLLITGLVISSSSLLSSKIIYGFSPIAFFLASFALGNRVKELLLRWGAFLGFISYGLYIIHYPLQEILKPHIQRLNGPAQLLIASVLIIPIAWLAEVIAKKLTTGFSARKRMAL